MMWCVIVVCNEPRTFGIVPLKLKFHSNFSTYVSQIKNKSIVNKVLYPSFAHSAWLKYVCRVLDYLQNNCLTPPHTHSETHTNFNYSLKNPVKLAVRNNLLLSSGQSFLNFYVHINVQLQVQEFFIHYKKITVSRKTLGKYKASIYMSTLPTWSRKCFVPLPSLYYDNYHGKAQP